jgi:micrococcal nuclease
MSRPAGGTFLRGGLALAAAVAWSPALAAGPDSASQVTGRAVAVESGDTFTLEEGGRRMVVRLADIGAPQGGAFFAPGARTLLANILADRDVRVVVAGARGADGILGRAFVGELDVNLELVKRGAAWLCIEYATSTEYLPFQNQAIRRREGAWSQTTEFDARIACRARPPVATP